MPARNTTPTSCRRRPGRLGIATHVGLTFLPVMIALILPVKAQELELRFGGGVSPDVEAVYERGLHWLAQNQAADGSWGSATDTEAGPSTTGITGMAVMALLAGGEDPNFGKYQQNIRKAVQSLIRNQNPKTGYLPTSMYHHGFAMLGLAEVYGVLDEESLWNGATNDGTQRSIGEALDLAVRCVVTAQKNNQWGGWRYSPQSSDADTSVSGAVLMGLLAARNAGIKVPDEAIDNALNYFRQMTSGQGGVGYSGGIGGLGGSKNLQAIATLVYAVGRRKDLQEFQAVQQQVVGNLEYQEGSYPEYFRYYMAQALFQSDVNAWEKWNQMTVRQLKISQNEDGSFVSGHGRAYGTAMSMLAIALNYRLLPIYER